MFATFDRWFATDCAMIATLWFLRAERHVVRRHGYNASNFRLAVLG